METFKAGDVVVCMSSYGYSLTDGKEYTVMGFQEAWHDSEGNYTFPPYVSVIDDESKMCSCHTYRFKHKN